MGLVKEPDKVDFYVLDKSWTVEERKELSAFIKLRKEQSKKSPCKKQFERRQLFSF